MAATQSAASAASRKRKQHADPFAVGGSTWKTIDVGDELLVGAEHDGFMGLEVLEVAPKQETPAKDSQSQKKQKRAQLRDLQQQVAALQAENARLKKHSQQDDDCSKSHEDGVHVHVHGDNKQEQQGKETHPHAEMDMGAWAPFDLHPAIVTALQRCGFAEPTAIQRECLTPAIQGRCDVIGAAQTGSGKTLAFGLPIIQCLLGERRQPQAPPSQSLRALVLTPTRELAMQVCEHMRAIAKPNGVWVVPIVGGISPQKQERLLRKRPEVVVATPGRLWDLMQQHHSHLTDMQALSFLVLDEADHMVQLGHFKELSNILALVPFRRPAERKEGACKGVTGKGKAGKKMRVEEAEEDGAAGNGASTAGRKPLVQVFVFSATLTLPAALRQRLKGKGGSSGSGGLETLMDAIPFRPRPKVVDLTADRALGDKVSECYLPCSLEERDSVLYALLTLYPGRKLVFTNAISTVRRVASLMKLLGLPVSPLHASMQQRQRLKYLDRFRSDEHAVLIASDVAARGLDIPDVRCVVHYQIPAAADVYVHRCGRTARAARDGIAMALVTPADSARFAGLFKAFDRPLPPLFPIDQAVIPEAQKRVRLAVRLDERLRLLSKRHAASSWRRQTAEALELQASSEEDPSTDGRLVRRHLLDKRGQRGPDDRAEADGLQEELSALLLKPLVPGFSKRFFTGGAASRLVRGSTVDEHSSAAAASSAAAFVAAQHAQHAQRARPSAPQKRKTHQGHLSLAQQRAVALRDALVKKQGSPGKLHARPKRMLVVPEALAMAARGEDALAALKRHAANTGSV